MVELALIAIGLVVGLAIGRWWALLAAVILAAWIFQVTEVDEVPAWFLALAYGVLSAAGIALGVVVRRALR